MKTNFHICLFIITISVTSGTNLNFNGQFITSGTILNSTLTDTKVLESRYLLSTSSAIFADNYLIDYELSGNLSGTWTNPDSTAFDLDLYRGWGRFATDQLEFRLGLQKLNFGPARLMRSLQWFDQLDPTNPSQFTTGVYGLRLKYDFLNNASLWLWTLYGNNDLKGLELIKSEENSIETGGRLSWPVLEGELAFTTHYRRISEGFNLNNQIDIPNHSETRFALDGIWDIGIGIWFESAIFFTDSWNYLPAKHSLLTLGSDYTFAIGNGLTVTAEYFNMQLAFSSNTDNQTSNNLGIMLSYPLSMLDMFSLIMFYSEDNNTFLSYLTWQRTYDNWTISSSFILGTGEDAGQTNNTGLESNSKGLQVMLIYNH